MEKQDLVLLDINLSLFDGEGGAPAGGAEGDVASPTGGKQQIIYGKQEDGKQGDNEPNEGDSKKEPAKKQDFESLIKGDYKEDFDKRVQDIINKRFKESKTLEKQAKETSPIMDLLHRKYGTASAEELNAKMEAEYIEEMAYQNNMTPENYKKILNADKIEADNQRRESEWIQQQQINEAVQRWTQQADEMKADYPDFNLAEAMQNDQFVDLIKSNIPVKTAYEILDFDNLKAKIANEARSQVTANIQSKQARPREAAGKNSSGVTVKSDVSSLTKEDRAEIAKRASRGEKISFG